MSTSKPLLSLLVLLQLLLNSLIFSQIPVGTLFTYQGSLSQSSTPGDGVFDFDFKLFDSLDGTTQVGDTILVDDCTVSGGFFSVELDFGIGIFNGDQRWLEIGVRPGAQNSDPFTILSPRQMLSATPYALGLKPGATVNSSVGPALTLSSSVDSGSALVVNSTSTTGNPAAIYSTTTAESGAALAGYATNSVGINYGVYGGCNSWQGVGVHGQSPILGIQGIATGLLDTTTGILGTTSSPVEYSSGVKGMALSEVGPVHGVTGGSTSDVGTGVVGVASHLTGINFGVHGSTSSPNGFGVYSTGNAHVEGNLTWKKKTGYVSVAAAGFNPGDSTSTWKYYGGKLYNTGGLSVTYRAPIQLPHGATIAKLTLLYNDVSVANEALCQLWEINFSGGEDSLVYVYSEGSDGVGSKSATPGFVEIVDNSANIYYVEVTLPDTEVGFYGAIVEYSFTEPY